MTANPRLLVALATLQFTLFPIPIITLFWKDQIGLSIADIFLLQAVFGLAVALLQFPSGYVADRVGYRRSLLGAATPGPRVAHVRSQTEAITTRHRGTRFGGPDILRPCG